MRPPGEVASTATQPLEGHIISYTATAIVRDEPLNGASLRTVLERAPEDTSRSEVTLIVIESLQPLPETVALLRQLGLGPLDIEDMVSPGHRPVIRSVDREHGALAIAQIAMGQVPLGRADEEHPGVTQLSVVQSGGIVVVLCERPLAFFGALTERIRSGAGRVRTMDGAYLLYAIIDLAIDAVSTAVAAVRDRVDEIEATILAGDLQPAVLPSIAQLRALAAIIERTTDVLAHELDALFDPDQKDERTLLASVPPAFLKDARDHAYMVAESARARTEQLVSLVQLYAAVSGTRLNEVTKTLTIIATIFIPLTFIAGIYGMNFAVMPELTWRWGYAAVLGVMSITAAVMVVIFKRKRWL